MTHFINTIKSLKSFNPKSAKVKKAKSTVIRALYAEEGKEEKEKRKQSPRKRKGSFVGFLSKSASKAVSNYQERQREKRIEKAHKVKAIRESNLPDEKKKMEQAKLNVPIHKTAQFKSAVEAHNTGYSTVPTVSTTSSGLPVTAGGGIPTGAI